MSKLVRLTMPWDYIVYVDETRMSKDDVDKMNTLTIELVHLESLENILRMARLNKCRVVGELKRIACETKEHYQRLQLRK